MKRTTAVLIGIATLALGVGPAQAQTAPAAPAPSGLTCSTGTLFAGNPMYDGQPNDRITPGTAMKADRPFKWQNLLFVGNTLYSRDSGGLWSIEPSDANPVINHVTRHN